MACADCDPARHRILVARASTRRQPVSLLGAPRDRLPGQVRKENFAPSKYSLCGPQRQNDRGVEAHAIVGPERPWHARARNPLRAFLACAGGRVAQGQQLCALYARSDAQQHAFPRPSLLQPYQCLRSFRLFARARFPGTIKQSTSSDSNPDFTGVQRPQGSSNSVSSELPSRQAGTSVCGAGWLRIGHDLGVLWTKRMP